MEKAAKDKLAREYSQILGAVPISPAAYDPLALEDQGSMVDGVVEAVLLGVPERGVSLIRIQSARELSKQAIQDMPNSGWTDDDMQAANIRVITFSKISTHTWSQDLSESHNYIVMVYDKTPYSLAFAPSVPHIII